ncbi:MAG: hypothetical protein ACKO7N_00145, partial [Candidatus Nitrosotenuis sp.]
SEKLLKKIVNDHVYSGFAVTASSGVNRSVDVGIGVAKIKGYHVENDATETTAYTFPTDNTHYLYIQLIRDANGEPESWAYTSNTTATTPTDSLMIAKVITASGDVSSVDQSIDFKKQNNLYTFVGSGSEINALTTFSGMMVFCTKTESGFIKDRHYFRDTSNTYWVPVPDSTLFFGDGSDGDITLSPGTTTLTTTKAYNNLTIPSSSTLTSTEPMIIYVKDTLTVNGTIEMNGKGGAGGQSVALAPGAGGPSAGAGPTGNAGTPGGGGGTTSGDGGNGVAGGAGGNGGGYSGSGGTGGQGGAGGGGGGDGLALPLGSSTSLANTNIFHTILLIANSPKSHRGVGGGAGGT